MKRIIYSLVPSKKQVQNILENLFLAGFSKENFTLHSAQKNTSTNLQDEEEEEDMNRARSQIGSFGLLAGLGALSFPGLGDFVTSRSLLNAISESSSIGGGIHLRGMLTSSGIPDFIAKKYEAAVRAGHTLMKVCVDSEKEVQRVTHIISLAEGKEISVTCY